jgi:hypothetical protein
LLIKLLLRPADQFDKTLTVDLQDQERLELAPQTLVWRRSSDCGLAGRHRLRALTARGAAAQNGEGLTRRFENCLTTCRGLIETNDHVDIERVRVAAMNTWRAAVAAA